MRLMQRVLSGLGLVSVCVTLSAPARAETLADALAYGYEASGLLEQNRALLRAADEGVAQAVSALLPVVSWSANAQTSLPNNGFSDFVTAGIQLNAEL